MSCDIIVSSNCIIKSNSTGFKVNPKYKGVVINPITNDWTLKQTVYDRVNGTILIVQKVVNASTDNTYFASFLTSAETTSLPSGKKIIEYVLENVTIDPNRAIKNIFRLEIDIKN